MKLQPELKKILEEWMADFNYAIDHSTESNPVSRETVKRAMLTFNAYSGTREDLEKLTAAIMRDWRNNLDDTPAEHVNIVDIWSKDLGVNSIREEQHKVYWLAREVLKNKSEQTQDIGFELYCKEVATKMNLNLKKYAIRKT